ncbi:MAG: ATP-dependent Clp protease ATP-binding subunit [Deltaproteobacteria bacterium]|nr:ATP-dependent Clp protease ATP-binding subunit [Deltaproteobacteria bacterium]
MAPPTKTRPIAPPAVRVCSSGYHTYPASETDPQRQIRIPELRLALMNAMQGRGVDGFKRQQDQRLAELTQTIQDRNNVGLEEAGKQAESELSIEIGQEAGIDAYSLQTQSGGTIIDPERSLAANHWFSFRYLPTRGNFFRVTPEIVAAVLAGKVDEREICVLARPVHADGTIAFESEIVVLPAPILTKYQKAIAEMHSLRLDTSALSAFTSKVARVPAVLTAAARDNDKSLRGGKAWHSIGWLSPQEAFHLLVNLDAEGVPNSWEALRPDAVAEGLPAGTLGSGPSPTTVVEMLRGRRIGAYREYFLHVDRVSEDQLRNLQVRVGQAPTQPPQDIEQPQEHHPIRVAKIRQAIAPVVAYAVPSTVASIDQLIAKQTPAVQGEIKAIQDALDTKAPILRDGPHLFFGTAWATTLNGLRAETFAYLFWLLQKKGRTDLVARTAPQIGTHSALAVTGTIDAIAAVQDALTQILTGLSVGAPDERILRDIHQQLEIKKETIAREIDQDQAREAAADQWFFNLLFGLNLAIGIPGSLVGAAHGIGYVVALYTRGDLAPPRMIRYNMPDWIADDRFAHERFEYATHRALKLWAAGHPRRPRPGFPDIARRNVGWLWLVKNTRWQRYLERAEKEESMKEDLRRWGLDVETNPTGEIDDPQMAEEARLQRDLQSQIQKRHPLPNDPLTQDSRTDPLSTKVKRIYDAAVRIYTASREEHHRKCAAATPVEHARIAALWNDAKAHRLALDDAMYEVNDWTTREGRKVTLLDRYSIDMLAGARQDREKRALTDLRHTEINQARASIAMSKWHIFHGDYGVGKTAAAKGLAGDIVDGKATGLRPDATAMREIRIADLVAGTKYRGEFEERIRLLFREVAELARTQKVILFIDEVHMIVGAGGAEGTQGFSEHLKPIEGSENVTILGATTTPELKHLKANPALLRRFNMTRLAELSPAATLAILRDRAAALWEKTGIALTDAALERLVDLTEAYKSRLWQIAKQVEYRPSLTIKYLDNMIGDQLIERYDAGSHGQGVTLDVEAIDRWMAKKIAVAIPPRNEPLPVSLAVTDGQMAAMEAQSSQDKLLQLLNRAKPRLPNEHWAYWESYIQLEVQTSISSGLMAVVDTEARLAQVLMRYIDPDDDPSSPGRHRQSHPSASALYDHLGRPIRSPGVVSRARRPWRAAARFAAAPTEAGRNDLRAGHVASALRRPDAIEEPIRAARRVTRLARTPSAAMPRLRAGARTREPVGPGERPARGRGR